MLRVAEVRRSLEMQSETRRGDVKPGVERQVRPFLNRRSQACAAVFPSFVFFGLQLTKYLICSFIYLHTFTHTVCFINLE